MKKYGEIFSLVVFGLIAGIVIIELLWHLHQALLVSSDADQPFSPYVYLYGGQRHVFRNQDDFYLFSPDDKIRVAGALLSKQAPVVEFDYYLQTNNLGLIDTQNTEKNIASLLFVGDSFTAGEGAEPWVSTMRAEIDELKLQPINGGVIGAGFGNFAKLARFLSAQGINIRKVLVIFISDDYVRPIRQMPEKTLNCMDDFAECDGSDVMYPVPFAGDLTTRLEKIRERMLAHAERRPQTASETIRNRIKWLLPATSFVYAYVKGCAEKGCLTSYIKACWTRACSDSVAGIDEILNRYGRRNVLFVHLPEKQELERGPNWIGRLAREAIDHAHGMLFDGFRECHLTMDDYYVIDGHPNRNGYEKIASCVKKAATFVSQSDSNAE